MLIYRLFTGLGSGNIVSTLISVVALIVMGSFSLVLHEVAHGYVAKLNGDLTAKNRGRLSFNPFKHFDVVGLIFMLLVGFGWAKPVPIDATNFRDRKKGIITVSIAGVCANLALGLLCLLLVYLFGLALPSASVPNIGAGIAVNYFLYFIIYLLEYGVLINFMLAFFNILPIYPLDGFVLLNTFLPRGNAYSAFMYRYGLWVLIGVILVGQISSMFGFKYLDIFGLFSELIVNIVTRVLSAGVVG